MWSKILLSECAVVYRADVGVLSRIHEKQQTHRLRHLLEHDGLIIAEYIVPRLMETDNDEIVYLLAKRNAKLNNKAVVSLCVKEGKIQGFKHLVLDIVLMYGKIRPSIRKIYYSLFRKVKTT